MEKINTLVVSLIILSAPSFQIYVPDEEINQKPIAYTSGIKTAHRGPIRLDHNYSRVYHQSGDHYEDDRETTQRPYPVYNGHTYGSRPPNPVYVLNGTRIRKTQNPTRQIVIFNKQKRTPKVEIYRACPRNATGQFVYEASCNQFLNCWRGRGYVQNCAPGTLFNPKTLECDYPDKVYCISGPRQSILHEERSSRFQQQIGCPKEFSGLIPNYTDCSKFINCVSGIENLMDCPPGTLFDVDKNICDFAHKANCFNGQNENLIEQNIDGKLDFQSGQRSSGRYLQYRHNEIRCPEGPGGLYAHPTDCSKFLNCANGMTHVQECGPGTHFNPVLKICDFPYNARCQNGTGSGIGIIDGYNTRNASSGQYGSRDNQYNNYRGSKTHHGQSGYVSGQQSGSLGRYNQNRYDQDGYYGNNRGTNNYDSSVKQHGTTRFDGSSNQNYGYHGTDTGYNGGSSGYKGTESFGQGSGASGYTNHGGTNSYKGSQHNTETLGQNIGGSGYDTTYGAQDSGYYGGSNQYKKGTGFYGSTQYRPSQYPGESTGQENNGWSSNRHFHKGTVHGHFITTSDTDQNQNQNAWGGNQYNKGIYGASPTGIGGGYYSEGYDAGSTGSGQGYGTSSIGSGQGYGTSSIGSGQGYGTSSDGSGQGYGTSSIGSGQGYGSSSAGSGQGYGTSFIASGQGYGSSSAGSGQGYGTSSIASGQGYGTSSTGSGQGSGISSVGSGQGYGTSSTGQGSYSQGPDGTYHVAYGGNQNRYNQRPLPDTYRKGDHGWRQEPQPQPYEGTIHGTKTARPQRPQNQNIDGGNQYYPQQNPYGSDSSSNQRTNWQPQGPTNGNRNNQQENRDVWAQPNQNNVNRKGVTLNPWYNQQQNQNNPEDEGVTANYEGVVNINHVRKTTLPTLPYRNSYEPFFGPTSSKISTVPYNDYDDTYNPGHGNTNKFTRATTPRIERSWPPPFPSTDVNADYVFEYEDEDRVTLEAENTINDDNKRNGECSKSDFRCSGDDCIPKTLVCNGAKDCQNGHDELKCLEYVSKFALKKNKKLAVLEKERWDNVTIATCALLCMQATKLHCRSFNYRKIDRSCFLTNTNEPLTGALIAYYPFDYYELLSEQINCSGMYVCENKKCIEKSKICDGHDDCGDRMDEKGCKTQDFGYSVKLEGSKNKNEGSVQVTAFGKTGYICDDKFGLRDANVVCKELGFHLGAIEVKKNSFFTKNITTGKPFYMMDDVTCLGNETRLMDCDFNGWGVHNCLGQEIVGVVCKTPQERCADEYWQCDTGQECLPLTFVCDGLLDCTDGSDEGSQHCDAPTQIRLVNGSDRREGRLEIRHHGIWGTVCDDDFNEDAAKVVCKQLGYTGSAVVKKEAHFGSGSGPIWLDQVFCSGNETKVDSCSHWNWGEHNCEHGEDVGVVCSNEYHHYERHSRVPMPRVPQVYPESCGLRKDNIFNRNDDVHFRVVRGSVAPKGDYPWQAAIRVKGKGRYAHWCGAVIISERFVLTAAHCLIGYSKGAYVVVAGDYNVDEPEGTEQEAYIEDFYLHESFRQGHKMNNDIALVKLKGRGFRLNDDVRAICLPESDASYELDQNCTISGFGSVESGKSAFSHDLRAGWVPLQKREICAMPHVYGDALTEGMICAGSLDEGIDSCDGDSGGPLACLNAGVFTLYGITSWGQHCGHANKPGVYVKIAHYRKWIDDNFQKHSTN